MEKILEVRDIQLDPALQPRAAMDEATIEDYTEVLTTEGRWPFPPVGVVFDGQKYWLWDGFHRVQAAQNAGVLRVPATIQTGDRAFALWRSLGANKTHGLRRSNADKRRATEMALITAPQRSDREIAGHVGVSPTTVGTIRKELAASVQIGQIENRTVTRGGQTYEINTTNIGGQAKDSPIGEIPQLEAEILAGQRWYCPHCSFLQTLKVKALQYNNDVQCSGCGQHHPARAWLTAPKPEAKAAAGIRQLAPTPVATPPTSPGKPTYSGMPCPRCNERKIRQGPAESYMCDECGATWFNSVAFLRERDRRGLSSVPGTANYQMASKPIPNGTEVRATKAEDTPAQNDRQSTGQFDCPYCQQEKVVHVNGGAWCLNCGVRWLSPESFKLDYKNYQEQQKHQAHLRNLQALEAAAGGPETAAQVLLMERARELKVGIAEKINRIMDMNIIEDLETVNAWLEDFILDTPPEAA